MIPYPNIDPVIFSIGPLAIRWYSLAYIAGLILGALYIDRINQRFSHIKDMNAFDDLIVWCVFGVLLGGRLGYVCFYQPGYYFAHPGDILKVWQGGMSFHGGLVGVTVAIFLFCRKHHIHFWKLIDLCAVAAPIGLFFGRVANFINGELYGRVTDVPWSMVFPTGGPEPRHPSQLYEATLEGLATFILLSLLVYRAQILSRPKAATGVFLVCYSLSRIFVEYFREPDMQLGLLANMVTMGQLLSLPMLLLGLWLLTTSRRTVS